MKRYRSIPYLAIAGGILLSILRALQLSRGFEVGVGLARGGILSGFHGTLYLAGMALALVLWYFSRGYAKDTSFEAMFSGSSNLAKVVLVLCGFSMMVGGAVWCWAAATAEPSAALAPSTLRWMLALDLAFGLITIAAGGSLLPLTARLSREHTVSESTAYLTLPLLFWSALQLLIAYRVYSVSANLPLFAFELLTDAVLAMAFYHFARLLYGKPSPSSLLFFGGLGAALSLGNGFGLFIGRLSGAMVSVWDLKLLARTGSMLAGGVVLLSLMLLMTRQPKE